MDDSVERPTDISQGQPARGPSFRAIFRRRWWLIALLMIGAVAVALIGSLSAPAAFRSSMRLQVFVLDDQEVTLFTNLRSAVAADQIGFTQNDFREVLNSSLIAWRTINDLGLDMSARQLLDKLEVSVSGEFVGVAYEADSAQKAQDVLTRHVENALAHYNSLRARPAIATGQFIQEELDQQAQVFGAAQDALLKFQLEHNVGDLNREINAVQDLLRNLETNRSTALLEAARAEALSQQWTQLASEVEAAAQAAREELLALGPITDTATAEPLLVAQAGVLQAEADYQAERARNYRNTAANEAVTATAQRAMAGQQEALIGQRTGDLAQLISLSSEYNRLLAETESARSDYDFLRAKAAEARLKERQISEVGYLQVVEPAFLPGAPASSTTLRIVALAALVSLLAGLVLALLLELVSPTRA